MAKLLKVSVEERTETGKGFNRRMRAAGQVPGVFYDRKGTNIAVKIENNLFERTYRDKGALGVFDLEIDREGKKETYPALIWRIKRDPVKSTAEHIDFFGVDLDRTVRVKAPINVFGRAKGVQLGGKLDVYRRVVEIEAKPMDIPTVIDIDVTEYNIGDDLRISGLELPEGVSAYFADDYKILSLFQKGASVSEEDESAE